MTIRNIGSSWLKASVISASALALTSISSQAMAANGPVTSVSTSAMGLSAKATVASVVTAQVGPAAVSGGTAPPDYTSSAQVVSVNQILDLGTSNLGLALSEGLSTGLITSSASATLPTGTATATVNNLSLDLLSKLGIVSTSLLALDATAITSTTAFDGTTLTGTSSFAGLKLNNLALGVGFAPNTTILSAGLINIIANEQIRTSSFVKVGSEFIKTATLTTNALHVTFTDALVGGHILNGDVIISQSKASFTRAVPEASSWAMMIIGFGAVGFSLRSRNKSNVQSDRLLQA